MLAIVIAAFVFDSSSQQSANTQEARFLGTGTIHEEGPCVLGARVITHTTTLLWVIQIGDSWTTTEACVAE